MAFLFTDTWFNTAVLIVSSLAVAGSLTIFAYETSRARRFSRSVSREAKHQERIIAKNEEWFKNQDLQANSFSKLTVPTFSKQTRACISLTCYYQYMDIMISSGFGFVAKGEQVEPLKDYIMELYSTGNYEDNIWLTDDRDSLEIVDALEELLSGTLEVLSSYNEYNSESSIFVSAKSSHFVSYDFLGYRNIPIAEPLEEELELLAALSEAVGLQLGNIVFWGAFN